MISDANVDAVRQFLLDASTAKHVLPGAKLPTERALVDQLGVSRNVIRNALAVLEAEGRVVRKVGSGTYLVKPEARAFAKGGAPLADTASSELNPKQIVEARFAFEPQIASLAALNGTKTDFEYLAECARQYHRADTFDEFDGADDRFHTAIAMATHNPLVIGTYESFSAAHAAAEWGSLRQRFLTAERRIASRQEHDRILETIRNRDAAAAIAAVRHHLTQIAAAMLQQ